MSKDKILIVQFGEFSNTKVWLLLLVKRSGFDFIALASNREEAEYLKYHIQNIGAKEYHHQQKIDWINKSLRIRDMVNGTMIINSQCILNNDGIDDTLVI